MSIDPFKLAEQGYEVFPVRITHQLTADKELHFLTKEPWNVAATNDPAIIAQWQARFGKRITDWCLPTGHRNGFATIDIDSPEAEQWWSSQWLPAGKEVETPRDGIHIHYSLDGVDVDIANTQPNSKHIIHEGIDTRGEGGFVVAYTDDMSDIPVFPESVLEIMPKKQSYNTAETPPDAAPADVDEPVAVSLPSGENVGEVSPQEARVIKGLTDMLDALPVPWHKGAGYHGTQFNVACGLNRIANSPFYHTDLESAHRIFLAHAPLRNADDARLRDKRWTDAIKHAAGQWFDPPSDVPVRLDATKTVDKFTKFGRVDRLYWDGKTIGDVKDLIRELREAGATEQEAYSISWGSSAMNRMRERNKNHSGSTWGYVKEIYRIGEDEVEENDKVEEEKAERPQDGIDIELLTPEEADIVRNYPNIIDRYIMTSKSILAEPNMPLHYVNAWMFLSCVVGDRADIVLEKGRVPLSLWVMPLAPSAAGKGDAKTIMITGINTSKRGGFGDINAGGSASSEGLSDFIAEREGKVAIFNKDESASLLEAMHKEGSYEKKMMDLALDLYDGEVNRNLRVGNAKEGLGESVKTTFNMWLQTTWQGAVASLTPKDIITGFIGRFLIAVGNDAKITDESLRPRFASEFQVQNNNVHPMIKSMADGLNAVIGRVKNLTVSADDDVLDRYVKARKDVLASVSKHPQADDLRGVMLRVTDNMLKAAALLAVSEGRSKIEMADLLLALKSGRYWVRDALRLVEAISKSEYRKRIDSVVRLCEASPRTRSQIMKHFGDLQSREIIEIIERAEAEGSIRKTEDGKRWQARD